MAPPSFLSRKRAAATTSPDQGAPSPNSNVPLSSQKPTPSNAKKPSSKDPPAKRQKRAGRKGAPSSDVSSVYHHFGGNADVNITEEELDRWKAKSEEDKHTFAVKAHYQLLTQAIEREENHSLQRARLATLSEENAKIHKELADRETTLKSLQEEKNKADASLRTERTRLSLRDEEISKLNEFIKTMSLENAALKKAKAGMSHAEQEEMKDASYNAGRDDYVALFLAGDPNYDWAPKFGQGMASWIATFPQEHSNLLAEKQGELAETLAEEAATFSKEHETRPPTPPEEDAGKEPISEDPKEPQENATSPITDKDQDAS